MTDEVIFEEDEEICPICGKAHFDQFDLDGMCEECGK